MNFSRLAPAYFRTARYIQLTNTTADYSMLPRPFSSVAYIESGEADFVQDGRTERVRMGDLVFVPRGSTYVSYWLATPETVFMSCHFDFAVSGICSHSRCRVQRVGGLSHLREDFVFITEEYKKLGGDDLFAKLDLLSRFYKICAEVLPLLERRSQADSDPAIMHAAEYIESSFSNKIAVAELAKLCSLSESHFYTRFKNTIGTSPIEYKNRIAISHAGQLLADEPSLSVEEVSERLGFESSAYFRRVFKKITGMSPREFRNAEGGRM